MNKKFSLAAAVMMTILPQHCFAAGLDQAETVLNSFKADLTTIIPVIATIALMLSGVFYAMRMIQKDTFVHWFVGILIVGSSSEIVSMIVQ